MSEIAKKRFFKLVALIRANAPEADKALADALRLTPKDPNILHLAARTAESKGEPDKAITLYKRALAVQPNWFEGGMNLARVYALRLRFDEALDVLAGLAKAYTKRPEITEAQARIAQQSGRLSEAMRHWETLLNTRPSYTEGRGQYYLCLRQLCDWDVTLNIDSSLPPQIAVILSDDPALQRKAAENYCAIRFGSIDPMSPAPSYRHERLRIGYLSSDFHAHATAWLMAELFELHDRRAFEVYAYSYGVDDNAPIRQRLRQGADHFVELNALTPAQCAAQIRADEIDILIDLKGHTQGGRLDILAHRPAPKQIHWLGFPATTGASFIDGFVADAITLPQGAEKHFTEKVLRLPHSYQVNDRKKEIGPAQSRQAYGLPEGSIVLACFNQSYKITPEIFSIWCDLLRQRPDCVLWLFETNETASANLRRAAQEHGLNPTRIIFAKPAPLPEHLARYRHVDLALDTFPVGGHTTTSDALWVGAPVVTLAGTSFVSRVAASLLTAAGLQELVTTTAQDYARTILALIDAPERRTKLRDKLTQEKTALPLFDTPRFVKAFESLLQELGKE